MRPSRLFRSATFRLTLTYAGLFAISAAVLFAVIYLAMASFEEQQIRKSILAEADSMIAETTTRGGSTLPAEIGIRTQTQGQHFFRYALVARDGSTVGNLPILPPELGWQVLEEPTSGVASQMSLGHAEYFIYGSELDDGGRLYVAQDTEALEELRDTITNTFLFGGSITVGLALLGGLAASWRFLNRIEKINTAAQRIMDGAMTERVPHRGGNDEFDRLSGNLNRMLDRIVVLISNQKRVTSDIAHDLRTPLTRLRQELEQARAKQLSVAEYGTAIDGAIGETDEILRTFGALLRIAEIDSGEQKSGFTAVDLSQLLQRLHETYAPVAEDTGHTLSAEISSNITIRGDQSLLTQLFANLNENAIRHTPAGTRISLRLYANGKDLIGEVSDNGPGVPVEQRDKIFRPFYRLDESRSTPGSGLGLALVAAIAALHGATIALTDADPGTKFQIRFPATRSVGALKFRASIKADRFV